MRQKMPFLLVGILVLSLSLKAQVIITNTVNNYSLHIHNNELYSGSDEYIFKYDLLALSSPPDTVYFNPNSDIVSGMAWHNDYLYFVERSGDSLKRIKLNPLGSVENVSGPINDTRDLKLVGDTLYIVEVLNGMTKFDLSQSTITGSQVTNAPIDCRALAIHGTEAYITGRLNDIWKVDDITSSSPTVTNTGITNVKVGSITTLSNNLFFRHGAVTEQVDLISTSNTLVQTANFWAFYLLGDSNYLYGGDQFEIWRFMPSILTGVANISLEKEIDVFPNPTTGLLNFSEEIKKISIYDVLGKEVMTKQDKKNINISALPKSLYLIEVETKKGFIERHNIILE